MACLMIANSGLTDGNQHRLKPFIFILKQGFEDDHRKTWFQSHTSAWEARKFNAAKQSSFCARTSFIDS